MICTIYITKIYELTTLNLVANKINKILFYDPDIRVMILHQDQIYSLIDDKINIIPIENNCYDFWKYHYDIIYIFIMM